MPLALDHIKLLGLHRRIFTASSKHWKNMVGTNKKIRFKTRRHEFRKVSRIGGPIGPQIFRLLPKRFLREIFQPELHPKDTVQRDRPKRTVEKLGRLSFKAHFQKHFKTLLITLVFQRDHIFRRKNISSGESAISKLLNDFHRNH